MDNDTTQPFQPAPFPTFADQEAIVAPAESAPPTRRRKSRKSSATPVASMPTSSAARPKRKYTKRADRAKLVEAQATIAAAVPLAGQDELQLVIQLVEAFRKIGIDKLDPKMHGRVIAAAARLL